MSIQPLSQQEKVYMLVGSGNCSWNVRLFIGLTPLPQGKTAPHLLPILEVEFKHNQLRPTLSQDLSNDEKQICGK